MPHSVQRPFIPHHTPSKVRPMESGAEFQLAKPFVPGAMRVPEEARGIEAVNSEAAGRVAQLPGIEEFLQVERSAVPVAAEEAYSDFEEPDELPPVEHFLDPLPPVAEFAADDVGSEEWDRGSTAYTEGTAVEGPAEGSGWLETDWQNYDWRAAAALGETGESEASSAWATTDWDTRATPDTSSRADASRPTAAQAIASALDQIAERIRKGELIVPAPGTMSDPTNIAASLAAMLGIRQ